MQIQKTIDINWNTSNLPPLSHDNREQLEEEGFDRAIEMKKEGFTSGELNSSVVIDDEDHEVRGWWGLDTRVV